MRNLTQILVTIFCLTAASCSGAEQEKLAEPTEAGGPDEWVYLDNGATRLGVKLASGGAIGYFAESGAEGRNLLNHWDHGRLMQQSYYGAKDGSRWADKAWRWNPVQGGDYKGKPSKVLELRAGKTDLYVRTQPLHWATGADLPEVTLEQWVTLQGRVAHVRYKMTYRGERSHPVAHQEIPAFFVEPDLDTLVLYDGDAPWTGGVLHRSKPGWPNESRRIAENWAAYVNDKGFGVGAYVPVANEITCYRYQAKNKSSCSYFAPLAKFAITPGFIFEYDAYLTCGSIDQICQAFGAVRAAREKEARDSGEKVATKGENQ